MDFGKQERKVLAAENQGVNAQMTTLTAPKTNM